MKKVIVIIGIIIIITIVFIFQKDRTNSSENEENTVIKNADDAGLEENIESSFEYIEDGSILNSQDKIILYDVDGNGTNFTFTYNGESYTAIYSDDNWHIIDSYKIKNKKDIAMICQALIDIHQIHGSDMISYRTADDLAYEWLQHNIAYEILPEGNSWRENAKNVDLDPADQGKSLMEMYEARSGKKFNIKDID